MAIDTKNHTVASVRKPSASEFSIFERMRMSRLVKGRMGGYLTVLLFGGIALSGCRKEATTWNAEYAAPLVHTSLTIQNLVGDSNLIVNSDSTVNLHIVREIYTLSIDSLFQTPDTTISDVYTVTSPITISVSPGFTFLSEPEENTFNVDGAELTYFMLRSGQLNYEIESYVDGPTIDSILIPSASKSGVEFFEELSIPASDGVTPAVVTGSVDLTNYEFDLTGSDGLKYNTLLSRVSATLDPAHPTPVAISQADSIRVNVSFANIVPQRALGYFGDELVEIPLDSTAIPFMENVLAGSFDIDQISLDLKITDGVGVDKQVIISQINSIGTGGTVALSHSSVGSAINLTRPTRSGWAVSPETRIESFTNANSNLDLFIENLPSDISYALQFQINPFGDVSNHNDFFNYDYPLSASMELEMPLCFAANGLTLQDTIAIQLDADSTDVQSGTLTVVAENSFPFNASFQAYLKADDGTFSDPIVTNGSVGAAPVNIANEVVGSTISDIVLTLNTEQIRTLLQEEQLLINVVFNTTNSPALVKVMDWHKLDLRIHGKVEYQFNLE